MERVNRTDHAGGFTGEIGSEMRRLDGYGNVVETIHRDAEGLSDDERENVDAWMRRTDGALFEPERPDPEDPITQARIRNAMSARDAWKTPSSRELHAAAEREDGRRAEKRAARAAIRAYDEEQRQQEASAGGGGQGEERDDVKAAADAMAARHRDAWKKSRDARAARKSAARAAR
jgi:hypothetical protein